MGSPPQFWCATFVTKRCGFIFKQFNYFATVFVEYIIGEGIALLHGWQLNISGLRCWRCFRPDNNIGSLSKDETTSAGKSKQTWTNCPSFLARHFLSIHSTVIPWHHFMGLHNYLLDAIAKDANMTKFGAQATWYLNSAVQTVVAFLIELGVTAPCYDNNYFSRNVPHWLHQSVLGVKLHRGKRTCERIAPVPTKTELWNYTLSVL